MQRDKGGDHCGKHWVIYTLGMWEGHEHSLPQLQVLGPCTAREGDTVFQMSNVRLREER